MPYCAHCKNLGLKFTDHNLKERIGNTKEICCPVLLDTRCRFCKEKGHTIKYCPEIAKKNQDLINNTYIEYKTPQNKLYDLTECTYIEISCTD